jgi:hypothetical protein
MKEGSLTEHKGSKNKYKEVYFNRNIIVVDNDAYALYCRLSASVLVPRGRVHTWSAATVKPSYRIGRQQPLERGQLRSLNDATRYFTVQK